MNTLAKITEFADIYAGGGAPQNADDFSEDGIPFLRAGSLPKLLSGEKESDLEKITDEVAKKHKLQLHKKDSIVFAKSGLSATKGYIYRLKNDCYIVNHLAVVKPKASCDSGYLEHALKKYSPTKLILDAAYPSIRLSDIGDFKIPLPTLPEQKRIAAILDKANEIKAKREQAIAKLDALAQSTFVEMFGDPVNNSKQLPVVKLKDVGDLDRGVSKHRPRNAKELLGGKWPLIQTGDVANCDGYITDYKQTYSELGLKQSKLWKSGTLCITIAANIAKTGILTFDACFPDSVVGFTAKDSCTTEYVRVWLSFLQKMLEDKAPESAQKNINLAILRDLGIPLPPLAKQQDFENVLKKNRVLANKAYSANKQINELFMSLQHQAFTTGFNA